MQLQREVLKNTKSECMKETSTLVNIAAFKQLKTDILRLVIVIIMEILRQIYKLPKDSIWRNHEHDQI